MKRDSDKKKFIFIRVRIRLPEVGESQILYFCYYGRRGRIFLGISNVSGYSGASPRNIKDYPVIGYPVIQPDR